MFRLRPLWTHMARPMKRPGMFTGNMRSMATEAKPKKLGMKELAKQYGWVATGVYLGLSAIDLPIFFLIVHSTGNEWIINSEVKLRKLIGASTEKKDLYIEKALQSDKGALMTEFSVAYVLHKCFLVVRVPVTVAITPKVAQILGQWGFKVTKGLPSVDKKKLAAKVDQLKK